ncbi:hypothetical protein [Marinisporobacter balticus]|uniref:Uncharacterized protein n=1 Tax=Marinisporobacter balticus TaxID=2018667 RepID=A0A4R2KD01_9FIRM|nr:hypothetical protein [Marinisporobacter balticus]TCO68079.1 hypothetical protein EV214_14913 [Marinisporobacter balticus]
MKKTFSIKLLQFAMYAKTIILVLLSLLIVIAVATKAEAGFLYGIKEGLQNQIGTISPENVARYLGQMFFMVLFPIITMIFLRKRSYKGVIICLVLQLFSNMKNPLHSIMMLILLISIIVSKNTKNYFACESVK